MLKYIYVSPSDFLRSSARPRRGPARRSGRWARRSPSAVGVVVPRRAGFDLGGIDWPLLVVAMVLGLVVDRGDRHLHGRGLHPDPPGIVVLPGGRGGALFLVVGRGVPAVACCPTPLQAIGLALAADAGGSRASGRRSFPAGPTAIGGPGSLCRAAHRQRRTRAPARSCSSPCWSLERSLHSRPWWPSGPANGARRIAACSTGPPVPETERPEDAMRIYEGSPRQDFEEVFRSIGAFLDQRGDAGGAARRGARRVHRPGPRDLSGAAGGTWSDSMGTQAKETLTFLDDDIGRFMDEAVARRGRGQAASRRSTRPATMRRRSGCSAGTWTSRSRATCSSSSRTARSSSGCSCRRPGGSHHVLAEFTREDIPSS